MRQILYLILISFFAVSCQEKIEYPEITSQELEGHIKYLASEKLGGRYPGTEGGMQAAEYIRDDFRASQLKLLADEGMQKFSVTTGNKIDKENYLKIKNYRAEQYKDFVPFPFSGSSKVDTSIVFTGYGLEVSSDQFQWNDYEKVDVIDKWVMIIRGLPEIGKKKQFLMSQKGDRSKALEAQKNGAAGILFVSGTEKDDSLVDPTIRAGNLSIPVVHIKKDFANKILQYKSTNLDKLIENFQNQLKPNSFQINEKLKAQVYIEPKKVQTQNIIAEINIDSKNDSNDYIVVGAHYDHLGKGGPESGSRRPDTSAIHYGADDNASGVASVLELAERLSAKKDSLENNYMFIAFGAEEMGLIGSKYFTMNPLVDMKRIKAMINIDMIGRLKKSNELQIGGTGTTDKSEQILHSVNQSFDFKMGFSPEGYGPSDHSSFYSKDIPVFFISTGPHLDYHTPADNPSKINFDGVVKVTNYIYDLTARLSSDSVRLAFREAGTKEGKPRHGEKMKVTLGIMPDFAGIEKRGLRADMVIKGKTADRAGMQDGDIITAINGKEIGGIYDYMERLSHLQPGQTITIEIIRDSKKKVLMVQL